MALYSILLRLPHDLLREVEDLLSLASLLALGGTCEFFRDRVTVTLNRERKSILELYWSLPDELLEHVTWARAVFSGEAALAFILRDQRVLTNTLDICVSSLYAHELFAWLNYLPGVTLIGGDDVPYATGSARAPTEYVFRTATDRIIRLLASNTASPFSPIAAYPTTALFNYFDEFTFGCAYRNLTMNRRAVVPELWILEQPVRQRVDRITARGSFQQSQWSAAVAFPPVPFALYNLMAPWPGANGDIDLSNRRCLWAMGQCPGQSRFFGDPGSLVDFFAPHLTDQAVMAHWAYPPYGTTTIWRMQSAECDLSCVTGDHLLRDSYSESSIVMRPLCYGPFATAVRGNITVGEQAHRRVCYSIPAQIKIIPE